METTNEAGLLEEVLFASIQVIRGQKVMLDESLASLYQVPTKILNQAVRRNIGRFPPDFMFQLTEEEVTNLRSQIVTSSWGGRRHLPYAFTEQGVAMLSSVLKSDRAVAVNIQIMRLFVKMRRLLLTYEELASRVESLEVSQTEQGDQLGQVFVILRRLLEPEAEPRTQIGFKQKMEQERKLSE